MSAKPKSLGRKLPNISYAGGKKNSAHVVKKALGILIKDSLESCDVVKSVAPADHGLRKGKVILLATKQGKFYDSETNFDDENGGALCQALSF